MSGHYQGARKRSHAPGASGDVAGKASTSSRHSTAQGLAGWQAIYADPARDFIAAMTDAGLAPHDPADIVADGRLHRFRVAGDKPSTRNGFAVLHLDGIPSGTFGSWKAGFSSTWCARTRAALTPAERADLARRVEAARAQRDADQRQRHADAAVRATGLWAKARPADPRHPYLTRKRVMPHGARQLGARLVLPVTTLSGELVSLQFIDVDGGKMLLSGGRKRGCCVVVADPPDPWRVLIAEGWATGASLAEADTAARVLAAVDAGNLGPVARAARERWPDTDIVIAGDADDVGRRAAHAAALAINGLVLIPNIEGADWNDVAAWNEVAA